MSNKRIFTKINQPELNLITDQAIETISGQLFGPRSADAPLILGSPVVSVSKISVRLICLLVGTLMVVKRKYQFFWLLPLLKTRSR
jgi:hypothetical protein